MAINSVRRNTDDRPWAVAVAARSIDSARIVTLADRTPLDQLSDRTEITGLAVAPEAVEISDGKFEALGSAHVRLNYDAEGDLASFAEGYAFPLRVVGHFDGGKPQFDTVEVDTAAFFR